MNVSEKMKRDWNQRAQHHARFWIATENYQTEEVFAQSGQDTAQALLECFKWVVATIMESLRHWLWNWTCPEASRRAFSCPSRYRCVLRNDCPK